MSIVIVGSVALDAVRTPFGSRTDALGGSATFSSIAASFFGRDIHIVAVVGSDFPRRYLRLFAGRGIATAGLAQAPGKTFRWQGRYDYDLNTAITISTHLNVFKNFVPVIPAALRRAEYLFLANIDPDLQLSVLRQVRRPRLVAADSMNFWIGSKKRALMRVVRSVDLLLLNDAEARQLSGEYNLMKAARAIVAHGPRALIIKKGEHGVIYFSRRSHFVAPAYLLESLYDPTGAGDTFAGGLIGYLSAAKKIDENTVRKGIIYGSILASYAVEDFSVNRLIRLTPRDIKKRYDHFRAITYF